MSLTLKLKATLVVVDELKSPEIFNKLTEDQKNRLAVEVSNITTALDDFIILTNTIIQRPKEE